MRIDIVTIFPSMFRAVLGESIVKRAMKRKIVRVAVHNLRDYTKDKHRKVDDRPYGGGPGMVMKAEPIYNAVKFVKSKVKSKNVKIILLSPQGKQLSQALVKKLSRAEQLILICGHYEGVDERVKKIITDEISIGDYILTGGELPAMVLVDSVVRLLPGALGDKASVSEETFNKNLLEYPHYTRPHEFMGMRVPKPLLSGDHKAIEIWRRNAALARTKKRRPDLLKIDRRN